MPLRHYLPMPSGHFEKHVQMKHASSEVKIRIMPSSSESIQPDVQLKNLERLLQM